MANATWRTTAPASSQRQSLDPHTLSTLRRLLARYGARRLAAKWGSSPGALERAAAGVNVLSGTGALIRAGIARVSAGKVDSP